MVRKARFVLSDDVIGTIRPRKHISIDHTPFGLEHDKQTFLDNKILY